MLERLLCAVLGHRYVVERVLNHGARKVGCTRCNSHWAMHDGTRSFVRWDGEFEEFYAPGGKMTREIEVRLRVEDAPVHDGVAAYFEWVERECRKAGVPFSDGEPENGVLYRRYDPQDFGCTIWVYVPNVK